MLDRLPFAIPGLGGTATAAPAVDSWEVIGVEFLSPPMIFCVFLAIHSLGYAAARAVRSAEPHLAGHAWVTLLAFTALTWYGVEGWFFQNKWDSDRIMGYVTNAYITVTIMVGFQLYELLCCYLAPVLCGKGNQMLIHHVMALLLAVAARENGYLHYYGSFYMGVIESSSIALVFVDLFKQFPALRARYPAANEAARTVFAILFIAFRAVYWPFVSYYFWIDSLAELRRGDAGTAPTWLVVMFLVFNALLTSLQFYWTHLIVQGAIKLARGEKDIDKDR